MTTDYMSGDPHPMVPWVEFAGQVWRLPNQVIEQIIRHRDGMAQAEAESERDKDLQGL